jgi:hypothetical protein
MGLIFSLPGLFFIYILTRQFFLIKSKTVRLMTYNVFPHNL